MNDHSASMNPKAEPAESAEDVFARIQRRRGVLNATDADMLPDGHHERTAADEADATAEPHDATRISRRASQNGRHHDIMPVPASADQSATSHSADAESGRHGESNALVPLRLSESVWGDEDDEIDMDPGFPRSKTFRTLIRRPELALAVALPTAYLALRSRTIRRTAYQVGKFAAKQQLWKQVRRFTG
ncbi:MAG: hypothetical protein Q4D91_10110 [Lautropia sp.]|nr:hypothetical protein [Lautropia sp.]